MKKNLFFPAVAALLLTLSCTKEFSSGDAFPAASDQAAASGISFTASFESVKSSLDESGQPVWVSGDVIGITSSQDNNVQCVLTDASTGSFSGSGISGSAPYGAVYPWNAAFSFAGDVVSASVPAVQQLAGGQKIAPGAMVAACVSNSTALSFKNCVSLMRLDIPRSDIKSVVVETTREGEYLAGAFSMDLGAATLTAVPDAMNASASVTLLPEGSAFSAGSYYIALLPGEYTGLKITFTNTSDQTAVATKTSKTSCGRSRGLNWGSFFSYDISSAEALIAWSQSAPKFTVWDVVTLSADIALTSEQAARYAETVDFCGTFNGNNHSITGLTTPLFANLYGSVSNLDLTASVNYSGNDTRIVGTDYGIGILAHYLYKTRNASAAISNVTVRGSLQVKDLELRHNFMAGGLVGSSNGVALSGCKNYAAVTVDGLNLGENSVRVGGIAGGLQENVSSSLTDCENNAAVSLVSATVKEASVAGVAAYATQPVTLSGCTNNAAVSSSATATSTVGIAGVAATFTRYATLVNCENNGDVTLGGSAQYGYPAGVAAHFNYGGKLESPVNRGAVSCTGAFTAILRQGGIAGNVVCQATTGIETPYGLITDAKNYGEVKNTSASPAQVRLGGIAGAATSGAFHILSSENRGDITHNSATTVNELCLGGMAGYIGTSGSRISGSLSKCTVSFSGTANTRRAAMILGSSGTAGMTLSNLQLAGTVLGTTLTASNFADYIYQGTTPSTTPSDCTFLNE